MAASGGDSALIQPLDLPGALQILIAEVRAELSLRLLQAMDAKMRTDLTLHENYRAAGQAVLPLASDLVRLLLQWLPENSNEVTAWSEILPSLDAAVEAGLARAASIIEGWRETPASVLASIREVRVLVANALSAEPLDPLWLRPEAMNLAPRLLRLRRRRKFLQRRLTDPDFRAPFFDDPEPLS